MQSHVLFLTLNVFSATGGIEKVSRLAGKALHELCSEEGGSLQVFSMYDGKSEDCGAYFPATAFRGFEGRRMAFVVRSLQEGRKADLVILSHVNLLSVGYAIKRLSPATRLVLLAHGIEVWQPFPAWKRHMLQGCDSILPVSRFTRDKMKQLYGLENSKLRVVNNCLDPQLPPPAGRRSARLVDKYGLLPGSKVVLTLTRLSHKDWYKGYDDVLMAMKSLKKEHPGLRYMLIGTCDSVEKARLNRLICQQGLEEVVIFTGYVPDNELAEHFSVADCYIMPSRKEGFGIVFVEALYYGLPVIAGCIDGSVDALAGGSMGVLVDPDDPVEIRAALKRVLGRGVSNQPSTADVLARFGYPVYKQALWQAIRPFLQTEKRSTGKKGLQKKPTPMTMLCEEISMIQHCSGKTCKLTHSRRLARALRCSCLPKE
ncbi:MAG: glycosyltransferase family 1 protein [Sphingobacteriales bacterium]|nr:MAG: glycosyltransferase family 1 protein [Sphingobacteriales bacterium]